LHQKALVGFHGFTENYYVSEFFRKGKKLCWNVMVKDNQFLEAFSSLGDVWSMSESMVQLLERYVCKLYGAKKKTSTVNVTRFELFSKKHSVENKVIEISLLPPCQTSLRLHILRSNFVSGMWKRTLNPVVILPNIAENGWNDFGEIEWISGETFPENVSEMLLDEHEDSPDGYGTDRESDADE
jgi:hypothetical protein